MNSIALRNHNHPRTLRESYTGIDESDHPVLNNAGKSKWVSSRLGKKGFHGLKDRTGRYIGDRRW